MTSLRYFLLCRMVARNLLSIRGSVIDKEKRISIGTVGKSTRAPVDEIRRTEARLGREHRYLPQAGFYQGRIPTTRTEV